MSNDPSIPSAAVTAMREDWAIVEPLMGGTKAMRKAGKALLPQWPKEEKDAYLARLNLSTLLPAYSETVANMTGRVFADEITIGEDVPPELKGYCENIDRQGNSLNVWAQDLFKSGLSHGLCFVLVDYPTAAEAKTKADEKAQGLRPYAVVIKPGQVIGWKSKEAGGEYSLTQFRYAETVEEFADGAFTAEVIEQVRVLEPGLWQIWRKVKEGDNAGKWKIHDEGKTTLGVIPLAVLYTKRTGFMTASPPLLELAHLNIKHWQSQSDQDNILHVARVPLLVAVGVENSIDANGNAVEWSMTIGSSAAINVPAGGDLKYVEHTGAAIKAGSESLAVLVDEMRMAGAKLLSKDKQATKTAAQANEEAAQEMSPIETMAGRLEDCIDQVLQLFALWKGLESGGHVKVNGNFDVDYAPEVNLPFLLSMNNAGKISDETLFAEVKRRGVLSDDLDWQEELQKIADQPPALGSIQ